MASPFPGMDPYLEGEWWQELHETLAGTIRAQLVPQLPDRYVALLAKRYVLDRPSLSILDQPTARAVYPDMHVVARPAPVPDRHPVTAGGGSALTVTPPTVEVAGPELIPQLSVEIREVRQRQLVTLIELLSPINKRGEGARDYLDRRVELLQTPVHLLEIDLLRGGLRIPLQAAVPAAPYYTLLSRRERRPYTQVWAISLSDPLPILPVPLLGDDPDITLDLQAALAAAFALAHYDRLIDYTLPPPEPAPDEATAAWVRQTIQATGIEQSRP